MPSVVWHIAYSLDGLTIAALNEFDELTIWDVD
jgi:hypothetical protein